MGPPQAPGRAGALGSVEYTWAAVAGVVAVGLLEVLWLRTGIFRTATFWIAYGIVVFFQVLVDGWLTKLSSPIVIYNCLLYTSPSPRD